MRNEQLKNDEIMNNIQKTNWALRLVFYFLILVSSLWFCPLAQAKIIERIDFDDAAVLDIVKVLADDAGLDLVVSGSLTQRSSVQLKNIEAEAAIESILATNGIAFKKDGRAILISSLPIKKHQPAQVLIEAKVLEIAESEASRLGLSYNNQSGSFVVGEQVSADIKALVSEGKATVVASPRIATLDGEEAVINIGSRVPYAVPVSSTSSSPQWSVAYLDAGVIFRITPEINDNSFITTKIKPEVSSISEWKITTAGEFPVISTRNAESTLRVKNGETIIVGGLISESDRANISRVPLLGYLPILGGLFQSKTVEKGRSEIVFMITPQII